MDAHDPGKEHPEQGGDQGQRVILFADDFVVDAEDVLPDEACRGSVMHFMSRHIVHCAHLKRDGLSRSSGAKTQISLDLSGTAKCRALPKVFVKQKLYCSAACCLSQLS